MENEAQEIQAMQEQEAQDTPEQAQAQAQGFDVDSYFKENYGLSLAEAERNYNEAVLKASLAEAWDVSPKEAMKRLERVMEKLGSLPEEEQQKYNSIDGVVNFWEAMNAAPAAPPPAPAIAPLSFAKQPKPQAKSPKDFTKEEIAKDIAAYQSAIFDELRREGLI